MNFLGMGPAELLLILALALIVFGPQKLPEIGAQIGKAFREFRRTTSELSQEFNRSLQLELDERKIQPPPSPGDRPLAAPPPSPQASSDGNQPVAVPPDGSTSQKSSDKDLQPPY